MKEYKSNISEFKLKKEATNFPKKKITSSQDANEYSRLFYSDDIGIYESMFIILLNRENNTIGYVKISQGGVAGTVVDPKLIAKYAVDSLCSGVIMVHNHPSGNKKPSGDDLRITKKVKEGLKFFDISLLDHVIITEESYTSLNDEGEM